MVICELGRVRRPHTLLHASVCVMKRTSVYRSEGKQIFESQGPAPPGRLYLPFGCHDNSKGLCISKQSSLLGLNPEEGSGARSQNREPCSPPVECCYSRPTRTSSPLGEYREACPDTLRLWGDITWAGISSWSKASVKLTLTPNS